MATSEPVPVEPVQHEDSVVPFRPSARGAPAVEVQELCVRFRTTSERKRTSLKHSLFRRGGRKRKSRLTIDALDGVTFDVPTGTVFGVVGPNGAGKTTLFRAIAGVLPPTEGTVTLRGRVTPLLSLGLGFNRELSGRENIRLGGLANGLSLEAIEDNTDDIIAFADLGDAIDYPMYTYSSGMFGRLGFAVAAQLDPEILLIDEALSAGDASFKHKTTDRLEELCESDVTVMIVSHGLDIVKELAEGCLWLDKGRVRGSGPAEEIVEAYLEDLGEADDATSMEDF